MEEVRLSLQTPSQTLLPSFRAALDEYHAEGRHLEIGADMLPEYIASFADRASNPGRGRVPETVFWGVVDGEYVGRVSLRHHLNERLAAWGGHIGYEVRPSARGRGHGRALLAGVLPHARTLGLERVLLHCDESNAASARIIESAGGLLAGRVPNLERKGAPRRAYWIELQTIGERSAWEALGGAMDFSAPEGANWDDDWLERDRRSEVKEIEL